MNKKKIEKLKSQAKQDQIQRNKVRKLQKRVTIVGAIGITLLVLSILTGLFVDENQQSNTSYFLKTDKSVREIIGAFINNPPTITGEIAKKGRIQQNGVWLEADGQKFFVLMAGRISTAELSYSIFESEIDVKGTWIFNLEKKENGYNIEIKENSTTENVGYRSLQFWGETNRYSNNLFQSLQSAIN